MENRRRSNFWRRNFATDVDEAGKNISWGSIVAGVVTFFAVFFLFSLITSAIGFGLASPKSSDPLAGVGIGVLIWTVITVVVSLFCGGFVAGLASRRVGLLHGFLTWALSTVLVVWAVVSGTMGAVGLFGNLVKGTFGAAADAAGGVGNIASKAGSAVLDKSTEGISKAISGVDTQQLDADVKKALGDTDVKELQPNYLQGQLDEVTEKVKEAAKNIVTNPDSADETLTSLGEDLKQRAEKIGGSVDKEAISKAVAKNTELTGDEAQKTVDNIYNGYQKATEEAKKQITEAEKALETAKTEIPQKLEEAKNQAVDTVDKASNAISGGSVAVFVALLLGLCLTSLAGSMGVKLTRDTAGDKL